MSRRPPGPGDGSQHVTTISHDGRFWEVYLEFEEDPRRPDTHRGRFRFSPAEPEAGDEGEAVRTAAIIIEPSYEEAVHKARSFDDQQLAALLRSAMA